MEEQHLTLSVRQPGQGLGQHRSQCRGIDAMIGVRAQRGLDATFCRARVRAQAALLTAPVHAKEAAAEVASVELILANGETLRKEVVRRPLGRDVPLNVYWAELGVEHGLELWRNAEGRLMPCAGNLVEMAIARDSEGNAIGRRVPAWNANPTGDPDGPRPPRVAEECV